MYDELKEEQIVNQVGGRRLVCSVQAVRGSSAGNDGTSMTNTDAPTDLRRRLTVVGDDDGSTLLPMAVDPATGPRPTTARRAPAAPDLTLAQLERLQAAPFRRAA